MVLGRSVTGLAILAFVLIQVSAYGVLFVAPFLREFVNLDIGFGTLGTCNPGGNCGVGDPRDDDDSDDDENGDVGQGKTVLSPLPVYLPELQDIDFGDSQKPAAAPTSPTKKITKDDLWDLWQ
ncbi:hypothetical protein TrRE_jg4100, partial [Triparma retinervis]